MLTTSTGPKKMALTPENGWHLTPEGLALCEGDLKKALNLDLKEIGSGVLSEEINRAKVESVEAGKLPTHHFDGNPVTLTAMRTSNRFIL